MTLLTLFIFELFTLQLDVPEPVAFYPLNEEFKTNDERGRPQLKGVASNVNFTRGPNNETNGAYQFSGNSNSYIEFPNSDGILDVKYSITLMCWVRPGGKDGPLFNYKKTVGPADTDYKGGVRIWIVRAKFFNRITKFTSEACLGTIGTTRSLAEGKWVHVAATYNHTTGDNAIYVDGKFKKRKEISTDFQISTDAAEVRMGAVNGNTKYFNGAITQMRVYNVSLSAEQILAVMYQGQFSRNL